MFFRALLIVLLTLIFSSGCMFISDNAMVGNDKNESTLLQMEDGNKEINESSSSNVGGSRSGVENLALTEKLLSMQEVTFDNKEDEERFFTIHIEKGQTVAINPWQHPDDIEPNRLAAFYYFWEFESYFDEYLNTNPNFNTETQWDLIVPQEIVEQYIQRYFDVSPEHLRQSEMYYDAEHKGYIFKTSLGLGGGPGLKMNKLYQNGNEYIAVFQNDFDNQISYLDFVTDGDKTKYLRCEYD